LEAVIDKIIEQIGLLSQTPTSEGGFRDDVPITSVYFGDLGVFPQDAYPLAYVEPDLDTPEVRTTGYQRRNLVMRVALLLDARDYFEQSADEASGTRALVRASEAIRSHFERRSMLTLGSAEGVVNVVVRDTAFIRNGRGKVVTKESHLTLVVQKSFKRVLD
jgi:hypothetical protein